MNTKLVTVGRIINLLSKEYPDAKIALNYGDNFQLLVAVILSAQCTDERVNMVTPALFKRFSTIQDFAECETEELEKLIYSTGFYRNKAKNIRAAAGKIAKDYGGKVPDEMAELLAVPGVARKTANVILNAAYSKSEGIVVDTHVCRLSGLLGLVDKKLSEKKNAVKIEQKLMKQVPKKHWGLFPHLLIKHGRRVCIDRRPKCKICVLNKICPSAKLG